MSMGNIALNGKRFWEQRIITMLKYCLNRPPLFAALLLAYCCLTAVAQEERMVRVGDQSVLNSEISRTLETLGPPPGPAPEQLLSRFLSAEQKVREALNSHTFKRDVVLQTIGPGGEVTGQYIRNSVFVFDDRGNRIERVLFHPRSTIREMKITKEDIQDLAGAQLLGIDINEVNKYFLNWIGEEELNGRKAYVIGVRPRQKPDPHHMRERTFIGRIWLDATSLQVLNVRGIVEPQGKQRFPVFETWREFLVGPLRFPVRTTADDILYFPNQPPVHYRISVRYYDYKRFASAVKITEVD
ncbi:MAG TPA: hypothetical protein VMZ30_13830 [Pyrinomonadaceae bacterium]|nr:hypothetical protein [Pyrinomonadaceae bacterium]